MAAHDAIAQKDFYPHLPEIPIEVDEDEETIKIVQLVKSNEPLVCTKVFVLQDLSTLCYDVIHSNVYDIDLICFYTFLCVDLLFMFLEFKIRLYFIESICS